MQDETRTMLDEGQKMINLGRGVLTWDASERRSDRYGSVFLMEEGHNSFSTEASSIIDEHAVRDNIGREGTLVAVVKETRESTHIGDLFRGVFPRKPKNGTRLTLGKGVLFMEEAYDGGVMVGLRPSDGKRETDWLDIRALYDAHEQTIELLFYPHSGKDH